jgi:hypothetical protein
MVNAQIMGKTKTCIKYWYRNLLGRQKDKTEMGLKYVGGGVKWLYLLQDPIVVQYVEPLCFTDQRVCEILLLVNTSSFSVFFFGVWGVGGCKKDSETYV